jgi:hypothetical protein
MSNEFFNLTVNYRNEISATSAAHRELEGDMKFVNACQSAAAARETGLPNKKLRDRYEGAGLAESPAKTLADDGCKMRAFYKEAVTPEDFMACLKRDGVTTIRELRAHFKKDPTPTQLIDKAVKAQLKADAAWEALSPKEQDKAKAKLAEARAKLAEEAAAE